VKSQIHQDFLKLYKPIHNQLFTFCRAITGNYPDAEDLLQDAVISALEGFGRLKKQTAFKSYIFSIASNINKMKLRRGKFKGSISTEDLLRLTDDQYNPEALVDFEIIYEKILLLPRRTAESMILYYVSDLPIQEIRKIQGGSESGVKLRLKRGKKKLLSMLNTKKERKIAMLFLSI
jgi:RNA polymerase sigma-70 factor (ECF subfamily)